MSYLQPGLPVPVPLADGLDKEYWEGLAEGKLLIQRCASCSTWQWGPEWICHECLGFDLVFEQVEPAGTLYSYERVWHPVHPALRDQGPYLIGLVALDGAPGVRLVGNLLGDPTAEITIGAAVRGVFEHHRESEPPYTLLQWEFLR
jgi:uncharacterized OB-fold protein